LVREVEGLNPPVPEVVWIRDLAGSDNEDGNPRAGAIAFVAVARGERTTAVDNYMKEKKTCLFF
jgi:hypothetical protein